MPKSKLEVSGHTSAAGKKGILDPEVLPSSFPSPSLRSLIASERALANFWKGFFLELVFFFGGLCANRPGKAGCS